ncbi:MAG: KTSC domain-containing protein [Bacteroidetes bacterium]|nr:KTSC domain-containing protein [Bacteroidota bacterium]
MKLETVDSSAIHAIGYNARTRVLEIIFAGGGIYHFAGVPATIYHSMQKAISLGKFFQTHIKGRYPFRRLDPPRRGSARQMTMLDEPKTRRA